ncbi:hypothetical protein N5P37_010430 [Trichoderma harzianum]|nr:hypothetical protein N5P37_010430 [Trichoderma harzianum]
MVFKQWLLQINISLSALVLLPGSQQTHFSWAPAATFAILAAWGVTGIFLGFLHKRYFLDSWAATATDAPSAFAASGAKYLTKAQAFPHLPYKTPKEETQEKQHRECDAYAEMALQKTTQGQEAPLFDQELLAAQVKSIYAGLVMVETKCIEVDNAQSPPNEPEGIEVDDALIPQNWLGFALNNSIDLPALIALHSTLLHEQHDFFLASRHPAASPALRRLASKYAMPARMWRHGIHSFLELLRLRLPDLMEHMLTFIYLAYTMMAVLYETVPAFADTWI